MTFPLKPLPKDLKSFVRQTMVLPALDETTGIRVNFIFSFTPYETEAIKRAKKIKIMDREVNFASPEDLIIHKICWQTTRYRGCENRSPEKP